MWDWLKSVFGWIGNLFKRRPKYIELTWIRDDGYIVTILLKGKTMATPMKSWQKMTGHIVIKDNAPGEGNVMPVDPGSAVWGVSDPNIATITPSADTLTAEVIGQTAGIVQISCQASSGGVIVSGVADVQVELGTPVSLSIMFDPPVNQ